MYVVAFNCSPRKEGNTFALLQTVLKQLEAKGVETELIQVGGKKLHGCTACMKCRTNKNRRCSITDDAINDCIEAMDKADGILIGSPTYFADLTTEAKALIDRAGYVARSNDHMFARKVGAAVVAVRRAGAIHAYDSINHFFGISQMIIPGSSYWNLGQGRAEGEVYDDVEGIETMEILGKNMSWLLEKLS